MVIFGAVMLAAAVFMLRGARHATNSAVRVSPGLSRQQSRSSRVGSLSGHSRASSA